MNQQVQVNHHLQQLMNGLTQLVLAVENLQSVKQIQCHSGQDHHGDFLNRYIDNKNDKELVSREKADKYLPVDMYIGGVEHAVLHLLYSRFYTKFLHDIGVVDFDEPFKKLFKPGYDYR